MDELLLNPIGHLETPFDQKMGIPRQSSLAMKIPGKIVLHAPYNRPEAFVGLNPGQIIWLIYGFHLNFNRHDFQPMVRPPRLGGQKKLGVFSTRSPFRPNPLGLSTVEIKNFQSSDKGISIEILGCDMLNGSPLYDIKPYLTYADGHHPQIDPFPAPENKISQIIWEEKISTLNQDLLDNLKLVLLEILGQDIELGLPTKQLGQERRLLLFGLNLRVRTLDHEKRRFAVELIDRKI